MTIKLTIEEFDEKLRLDLCNFVNWVRSNQYEDTWKYEEDDWYGFMADYLLECEDE